MMVSTTKAVHSVATTMAMIPAMGRSTVLSGGKCLSGAKGVPKRCWRSLHLDTRQVNSASG